MKYDRIRWLIFCSGNWKREKFGYLYRCIFCLLMAILLVACSASNPPRDVSSRSEVKTSGNYQIGSFDLLQIDVFQVPELSQKARVNSQGFISLPLIGAVQVNGLTSQQIEELLAKVLGKKYLQNPQVSVFIEEYASQRVTVEGAVVRPGIYPIQGRTTLLQAIASAEGANEVADQTGIKLFRSTGDNNKKIFYYDIDAIRQGSSPDPEIHADDIIVVEESGTKVFFKELSNYIRLFANPFVLF